jgi:UDP-N-acetylmuramate dehydrogenase
MVWLSAENGRGAVIKRVTEGDGFELRKILADCSGLVIREGVAGARYTTFAIGGPLQFLVEPCDIDALARLRARLHAEGVPSRMLGAGSNVVIPDEGLAGVVIRLGEGFRLLKDLSEGVFSVGASFSVMRLSRDLSQAGFAGLEFAGGIPASFGGAVFMNAGAHGGEFGDVVERVSVVHRDGTTETIERGSLSMTYRRGDVPVEAIVVAGEVRLTASDKDRVAERRAAFLTHRKATQPLHLPSAGSVFRNPPNQYAGELIEATGLKGSTVGGAQVSLLHGNWIVNPERRATAADVRSIIDMTVDRVREAHGVELEPEVRLW